MKKVLSLICVLIVLVGNVNGQNCKDVKTEVDKFTKKEKRVGEASFGKIKMVSMHPSIKWTMEIEQESGVTNILANISALGEFNIVLDESTSFYFLLENDEIVKLNNQVSVRPVTKVVTAVQVMSYYTLKLTPSVDDLEKLSSSKVVDVKVEVPSQNIPSPKLSSKDGEKFRGIIECMKTTQQ